MERWALRRGQRARIAPLLSGKVIDSGITAQDSRLFVGAVLWITRTRSPWRDLPTEFGNWHSVYVHFSRWAAKGVWDRVLDGISRDRDTEDIMLDSTAIRAHQHPTGA